MKVPLALFVAGDGPRDEATVPPLVSGILGHAATASRFRQWSSITLARGSGFARKLRFVLREAVDSGAHAVVATVDRDKSPRKSRLADLAEGRAAERGNVGSSTAVLPVALGEADPHAEAWLLDDGQAVRDALKLAAGTEIPNVRKVNSPKDALESLCASSDRQGESQLALLKEIATAVSPKRCQHSKETGFARFTDDVQSELGALAKGA